MWPRLVDRDIGRPVRQNVCSSFCCVMYRHLYRHQNVCFWHSKAQHGTAQHSTTRHGTAREQQMKVAFFMSLLQCLHLPCAAHITVQACCMHSTDSNPCPFTVHHMKRMNLAEDQPAHVTHLLYGTIPTRCNIWTTILCFNCLSRGLL